MPLNALSLHIIPNMKVKKLFDVIFTGHIDLQNFGTCFVFQGAEIEKKPTDKQLLSRDMRFPTMWYVQPSKPQISLGIHAV